MTAVIGCAAWAIVTIGGMVALGQWLERDYQRGQAGMRRASWLSRKRLNWKVARLARELNSYPNRGRYNEDPRIGEILIELGECYHIMRTRNTTLNGGN